MTAAYEVWERRGTAPTLVFDLVDLFLRERGTGGLRPRVRGRVRYRVVATELGGVRTPLRAPLDMVMRRNTSGYDLWFGEVTRDGEARRRYLPRIGPMLSTCVGPSRWCSRQMGDRSARTVRKRSHRTTTCALGVRTRDYLVLQADPTSCRALGAFAEVVGAGSTPPSGAPVTPGSMRDRPGEPTGRAEYGALRARGCRCTPGAGSPAVPRVMVTLR